MQRLLPDTVDITRLSSEQELQRLLLMSYLQNDSAEVMQRVGHLWAEVQDEEEAQYPVWALVARDITRDWAAPLPEGVSAIYQTYLVDWAYRVHCCEIKPSYELWPVRLIYEGHIADEQDREHFDDVLMENGGSDIVYQHRSRAELAHPFKVALYLNRAAVLPGVSDFGSAEARYLWERETVEEVLCANWGRYETDLLSALSALRRYPASI